MQWRKSLWWWGVRPMGFAPGWGDTSVAPTAEFAAEPMRVGRPAGSVAVRPGRVASSGLTALKTFLHEQICDVEELRARQTGGSSTDPRMVRSVRYRHPVTGAIWDGEGRQPQWLRDALLTEGWLLADLRHAAKAGLAAH